MWIVWTMPVRMPSSKVGRSCPAPELAPQVHSSSRQFCLRTELALDPLSPRADVNKECNQGLKFEVGAYRVGAVTAYAAAFASIPLCFSLVRKFPNKNQSTVCNTIGDWPNHLPCFPSNLVNRTRPYGSTNCS